MSPYSHHRGFTLIELLVVIAIIGLLASIVLASLGSARVKARNTQYIAEIKAYQTALELYYNNNGSYPNTGWACIGTGYVGGWCYTTSYTETSTASNNFRSAMAPYIDVTHIVGPTNTANKGSMYKRTGNGYTLLMLLEGVGLTCPFGIPGALVAGATRCDYTFGN